MKTKQQNVQKMPFGFFAVLAICGAMVASPAVSVAAEVSNAKTNVNVNPAPLRIGPDFSDLSERLLPTVVNVATTQKIEEMNDAPSAEDLPDFPPGSPFEDFFKDFFDHHQSPAPQQRPNPAALGSGFVIDAEKGYIITNNHVIKDADEIKVTLHNDETIDAKLIGRDDKTDLAVLQIDTDEKLVAAKWGNSDNARVGSWVIAIGNPFGLGGTVTAGIVSARQRDINAGPYDDFIQSDASINRGNSGGPMFNMAGEAIGVNTAIFSPTGGSVGIGFSIPSNLAKSVVDQLIKYGKTKRGWLGVRIQVVTDEIAESLGLTETTGALVASVTPKGPADKAGVKPGDVILSFNGQKIDQMRHLPRIVAETEVEKKVSVALWRKGQMKTVSVTLGQLEKAEEDGLLAAAEEEGTQAPEKELKTTEVAELGFELSSLSALARQKFGFNEDAKGVLVVEVDREGSAAEKGLRSGDLIVEFDQAAVQTPKDVQKKLKDAKAEGRGSVLILLSRQGDLRFVALKIQDKKKK